MDVPPLPPGSHQLGSTFDPHVWFSIEMLAIALLILFGIKFYEFVERQADRR